MGMIEILRASEPGTMGIIMESGTADHVIGSQCDYGLRTVGNLATRYYGLALPKNSRLFDELSQKILELNGEGLLQTFKTKWWPSCSSMGSARTSMGYEVTLESTGNLQ